MVVIVMLERDRAGNEGNSDCQHRQKANVNRRWRRGEITPIIIFYIIILLVIVRRRGRRRRPEGVEGVNGLRLVKVFVWRWRRKVLIDHRLKVGRRLVSRRDHRETPARIRNMRAVWITAQISPIGVRRVGVDRSPPEIGFAQGRENSAHAWRLGRIGIMGQVLLVTSYRVALHRRRIGRVGRKAGDRLVGHSGGDRGRRRVCGAFEDVIGFRQLRRAPGKQRALRQLVDRHAGLVKHFHDVNTALAHRARKRLAKDTIWTLFIPR
jgi:hypothetical protein